MVNDLLKEVRLKGSVEYGKFVPEAFVQKKRGHLIQELRSEGVLGK